MGHLVVGADYSTLGEPERASEYYTRAFQLREHASEREKLAISANYYLAVTGELDKAAQTFQEGIDSYPRTTAAYEDFGRVLASQGQYEKAAEITRQAVRLAPDWVTGYGNLATYALGLQRFDEARRMIHEAQARKLDSAILHNALYALPFSGWTLRRWRNSNSGLWTSPKRTGDSRWHQTPRPTLVMWARRGN
jgi:tetratricopeptide (TPR) repeat protein